jgi:hypothetical protein
MRTDRMGTGPPSSVTEVPDMAGYGAPTGREGLADVVRAIASDVSLLVRQQVDLAKQEIGEAAKARARGVAAFAASAVLGLFVLAFLGLSAAAALDLVLPRWAAHLIVGGAFLALAVVALLLGRRSLRTPRFATERTKQTLREDVEWAKHQLRR